MLDILQHNYVALLQSFTHKCTQGEFHDSDDSTNSDGDSCAPLVQGVLFTDHEYQASAITEFKVPKSDTGIGSSIATDIEV